LVRKRTICGRTWRFRWRAVVGVVVARRIKSSRWVKCRLSEVWVAHHETQGTSPGSRESMSHDMLDRAECIM
jgi:hypothetical protein